MMMHDELVVAGLPLQFPKPTAGTQLPTLAEWNQRYIEYVLNFTKGKKTAAARILGINRRTLYRRKKARNSKEDMLMNGEALDTGLDNGLGAGLDAVMDSGMAAVTTGHQVQ